MGILLISDDKMQINRKDEKAWAKFWTVDISVVNVANKFQNEYLKWHEVN